MDPLLVLGALVLLSKSSGGGGAEPSLATAETGLDALAILKRLTTMTPIATASRTQTAFPTDWWRGPNPSAPGQELFLIWASADPRSWAAASVSRSPTPARMLGQGKGSQTAAIVDALRLRVL
jgi:hypothetical protein